MRNIFMLVSLLLFLMPVSYSFSQYLTENEEEINIKKWLPAKVGIRMGGYEDHYQNLTLQGLQSMIGSQTSLSNYLEDGFGEEYFTAITGTNIGLQFSLNPFSNKKGDHNLNHELRFGLSVNTERESMLIYQRESVNNQSNFPFHEEIIFCLIENEVLLDASYLFHWPLSQKFLFYGGFGANWGSTFDNKLLIIESDSQLLGEDTNNYTATNSSYFRVLSQVGMQVQVFDQLGMYLELQGGHGLQIVHGGENNALENCATFLGVYYGLGK